MGCSAFGFQHNDAIAEAGTAEAFLGRIEALTKDREHSKRWGALLTNYDVLSAYHLAAVDAVGEWDDNFVAYVGDVDWFYRLRLGGWQTIETELKVEHVGSQTRHSSPAKQRAHDHFGRAEHAYYAAKWGGAIHHERYTTPFNVQATPPAPSNGTAHWHGQQLDLRKIQPVIQSCPVDVPVFESFAYDYEAKIGDALPRPIVVVDTTKGEPAGLEATDFNSAMRALSPSAVLGHGRCHVEDYHSVMDAGWMVLERGIQLAATDCQALLFLEDDVEFSKDFLAVLKGISFDATVGCVTLYQPHAYRLDAHGTVNDKDLAEGYVYGSQCVLFPLASAKKLIAARKEIEKLPPGKDLRWFRGLRALGLRVCATERSYVQHSAAPSRLDTKRHRSSTYAG